MRSIHLSLGLAVLASACASGRTTDRTSVAATETTARSANTAPGTSKRTNIITPEEIRIGGLHNANQLVRQLRPSWGANYAIFIGETLFGGTLDDIDPTDYKEIRYYTPSEAQMRFTAVRSTQGAGVIGGAKSGKAGAGLIAAIQFVKK